MVGDNANEHSILTNLVNDSSAEILGVEYVGGIAGSNSGTITADEDNDNLVNRGSITGVQYVGGITGENKGTITNTNNDVELFVNRDKVTADKQAQYFGGVAGINQNGGTIKDATNTADVNADGANYVGGIAGKNEGTLTGFNGNYGNVTGASNVGGVIGENTTDIDNVDAVNDGTVIAMAGGAGGIFGVHTGDITNSKLVNNKDVIGAGDGGTGGIATTNSGKIINSILINEGNVSNATGDNVGGIFGIKDDSNVGTDTITGSTLKNNGQVTGKDNVGGIFGSATEKVVIKTTSMTNSVNATITGNSNVGGLIGSNAATITGGRNEKNSYYKYQIYNNGTITANSNGSNIGGLFGTNNGTVEAAYNTGVINADKSSNVGGIAGVNEKGGTLDQVFNTVMTENGTDAITGKDNVGGLVGTNSGTLSNAYNTTDVSGTTNVGNAVGRNEANATVNNVYDVNNTGNRLIAENNGNVTGSYSGNEADKKTTGITYVAEGDKLKEDSYKDSLNDADTWKFYDGYSNPLLKVFLTRAEYTGNESFTYNGQNQGLTINSNTITAADKLDAYNNANSLLTATQNKNAGEGYLGIYSQQIATSGKGDAFDPNNLGYDIDVTYDIEKKQLNITLDDVHRVYGNVAITQGGYQISNIDGWQGSDKDLANGITISPANDKGSFEQTDTALTGSNTGKVTENAGGQYTWSADVTLSEEIAQNYEITTTTLTGNSYVGKAKLTININDVTMTYGDKESTISNQYGYTVNNGLVNGDSLKDVIADMNYNNTAYNTDGTTKNVIDGKYALEDKDVIQGNKYGNYEVTINNGTVMMNKADLNIKVDNANTTVGKMPSELTGTVEGLTNGDTLPTHDFALKDDSFISVSGNHENVIGIVIGGKFYELGDADWSNGLFANYDIHYEMGDLAVSVVEMPDNWPNNRWDYLFADNPFDRNENFRERKAEVNFVDGAMEI